MARERTLYVTTPIYYVNGLPHIGHAYTTIAADVLTRYRRMKGHDVRFVTGTDEHGQKVLEKARERGMSAIEHCDDMVVHWKKAWDRIQIRPDRFIRTTDQDHVAVVTAVLSTLWEQGLIYKDAYTGWYYVPDETFVTDKDVKDGKYAESDLQRITETNYFFRMGNYQQQLIDHIQDNPDFIRPTSRRNEVLGFLRKPLGDLCISRPKSRMPWGIELPFDADYVTYVWFDALLNYLTAAGYHPENPAADWQRWWPADFQLIGKDILTTHAVYWSTMLMAMGVPLPSTLYAHGWWTSSEGEKISKSKGNAIDIGLLVDEFGVDALRYFLLREVSFGADGGFSYRGFLTRYNADLANDLGNLAHRGLSMTTNWLGGRVPDVGDLGERERHLAALAVDALAQFDGSISGLAYHKALEALWEVVKAGNKYVDQTQPWALNKQGDTARLMTVMRHVLEVCAFAATLLLPFMPDKATELLRRLGRDPEWASSNLRELLSGADPLAALETGASLDVSDPLFPRFRNMPDAIQALFADSADTGAKPGAAKATPKKKTPKEAKKPVTEEDDAKALITYDDFARLDLRAGRVLEAIKHPKADRLLVLTVDVGEDEPRTVVAGIANKFAPEELVNRQVVVVANLKPAKLRGIVSQGMLLAAGGKDVVDLVSVAADPGEVVR